MTKKNLPQVTKKRLSQKDSKKVTKALVESEVDKQEVSQKDSKTLFAHLEEIKNLAIWVFFLWLFGTIIAYYFNSNILNFLLKPLKDVTDHTALLLIRPTDGFMVIFKVCAVAGLVFSLPLDLILVWRYLSPALLKHERRRILGFTLGVFSLTTIALLYGYFSLIPASLKFLLNLNPTGSTLSLTITEYIDFLVFLYLILVAVFQVPLALFSVIKLGILKPHIFSKNRKYIHFFSVVILALLTPTPDLFTLILIALPISLMFEIAYFLAKPRKQK